MVETIDTAPTDGTAILLWEQSYYQGKGGWDVGLYDLRDQCWRAMASWRLDPTHWAPLPPDPRH